MNTESSHLCCRSSRFLSARLTLALICILDSVTVQSFSPSPRLWKKWVIWWRWCWKEEGWRDRALGGAQQAPGSADTCFHTSFIPLLLCTFQHCTFQMIDVLILNELLILRLNFWNCHFSHVRTQAHPSHCTSSHYVSHPHTFFFLTQQSSASFCFQDNHSISLLWFCHQEYCW